MFGWHRIGPIWGDGQEPRRRPAVRRHRQRSDHGRATARGSAAPRQTRSPARRRWQCSMYFETEGLVARAASRTAARRAVRLQARVPQIGDARLGTMLALEMIVDHDSGTRCGAGARIIDRARDRRLLLKCRPHKNVVRLLPPRPLRPTGSRPAPRGSSQPCSALRKGTAKAVLQDRRVRPAGGDRDQAFAAAAPRGAPFLYSGRTRRRPYRAPADELLHRWRASCVCVQPETRRGRRFSVTYRLLSLEEMAGARRGLSATA